MGDTIGLCWGGGGPPKSSFKNKVFGSVFTYLKVALRLKVCVDTTIGLVFLPFLIKKEVPEGTPNHEKTIRKQS